MSDEHSGSSIVTGTMVTANPGWEARAKSMCDPGNWSIEVTAHKDLQLSDEEWTRLEPKIALVLEAAQYMLAGMVKGTIKYPTDDYDLKTWFAHLIGEGADQMNYSLLLANAFNKGVK